MVRGKIQEQKITAIVRLLRGCFPGGGLRAETATPATARPLGSVTYPSSRPLADEDWAATGTAPINANEIKDTESRK